MSGLDFTKPVHGTLPQNLIEKIIRLRIYESRYWKEHCFALTGELLVDKAVKLQYFGGVCSENNKPTPFLCLLLKMLQILPSMEIVMEFIKQEEYKYVRCLGVLYLRLVGSPVQIYSQLEPLYTDYRKIRFQTKSGWELLHMDEWIDTLLTEDIACNIILPRLAKRALLVADGHLSSERESALKAELMQESDDSVSLSSGSVSSDSEDEITATAKVEKATEEVTSKKRKRKKDKKKKKKKKKEKKKKKVLLGLKSTPKILTGLEVLSEQQKEREEKEKERESKFKEGSVEYWNYQRQKLGLKKLQE